MVKLIIFLVTIVSLLISGCISTELEKASQEQTPTTPTVQPVPPKEPTGSTRASTGELSAIQKSAIGEGLGVYPTTPLGSLFEENFDTTLNKNLFEVLDSFKYWDSWFDESKTTVSNGNLLLQTDARDTYNNLLKVGGVRSTAFYTYGKFIIRAKTNPTKGTVSAIYLYNEDKDMEIGGRHEEIDIELSSKFPGKASLVTYHNDNWKNEGLQNQMHRGGIKNIREIAELENFDSTQFNEYVIDWEPGKVTWYINGIKVEEFTDAVPTTPMRIHIDTYNNREWDSFIDVEPSGTGALEIDSMKYLERSKEVFEVISSQKKI